MYSFSALPTWLMIICIDHALAASVPQQLDDRWSPFYRQSHHQEDEAWRPDGSVSSYRSSWISETETQSQTQTQIQTQSDTTCSSSYSTTISSDLSSTSTGASTTTDTTIISDSTTTITIQLTSTIPLTSTITIPSTTSTSISGSTTSTSATPQTSLSSTIQSTTSSTSSYFSISTTPITSSTSTSTTSTTTMSSSLSSSTSTIPITTTTSSSSTSSSTSPTPQPATPGHLPLSFVNNFNSTNVYAYVTGWDDQGRVVLLQPDGTWFHPTAGAADDPQLITANIAIPLGPRYSTTNVILPTYVTAAHLWLADGNLEFSSLLLQNGSLSLVEPSAVIPQDASAVVNWGFVELSYTPGTGVYADISYVDFVGLPIGMQLEAANGSTQSALGLPPNAVTLLCDDLTAATAADGQPWERLCVRCNLAADTISTNTNDLASASVNDNDAAAPPLRVLAPVDYLSLDPAAFAGYFEPYAAAVWSHYTTVPLSINTQTSAGTVSCRVDAATNLLRCDGDNRGYLPPSTYDIFSCASGPFGITAFDNAVHRAVVPRLCAAFNRGTLLLPGGNQLPYADVAGYYSNDGPNNRYSAIVHKHESDGKGYAFAYDDVVPDGGADAAGVAQDLTPSQLTVIAGGALTDTDRVQVAARKTE